MRITIRRISTIICVAVCLFSMTGCFFNPFKRSSGKSKSDNGLTYKEAADILLKEYSVQDYSGTVPDGMEIKYVAVKEVYMDNNKNRRDYEYDYDKAGRQTVLIDYFHACNTRETLTFNDDGTLAKKEYKKLTKDYGSHGYDYVAEYKYNENKQLISYTVTEEDHPVKTYNFEYENGHLISGDVFDKNQKYDYCTSGLYYDYCVKVRDSFNYGYEVYVVKRTYSDDTFERVLTEMNDDNRVTYFEYDGDTLTGWYWIDEWGKTIKWDANDHLVEEIDKDGSLLEKSEYNEHKDRTLYVRYEDGELVDKVTSVFEYDGKGNKLSETSTFWYVHEGKEDTFISVTKYDYDERGLLRAEVNMIDDWFSNMTVYAYKAIIVPAEY